MKRYINLVLSAAWLSFTVVATPVEAGFSFATDYSKYPGNNCQSSNGSQAADFYLSSSGIRNMSSAERWITCPIPNNSLPYGVVNVKLAARGSYGSSLSKILCMVINSDRNGRITAYKAIYLYSWGGDTTIEDINTEQRDETVYQTLQCRLPAQSELFWYYPNNY